MKKRIAYVFVFLVVSLLIGGALLVKDSAAQTGSAWLSFDGLTGSGNPALALLSANPQSIELQASLPGAQAETVWAGGQAFTRLSGEGYGFPTEVGRPELPVLRREVEVPFGAQVTIELVSAEYIDVSLAELGLHSLYPMQPPLSKLAGDEPPPFTLDTAAYTQPGFAPASPLATSEAYITRGHRLLLVEVWPIAYDPVAGTLRLYSQVTFRLRLAGSDMLLTSDLAQRYASPAFDQSLSQRVLNYNQGLALPEAKGVGYLIITADAYYDAILPLADLRQSRGFAVSVIRLSELPGATAQDIQDYILNIYHYGVLPPSYVLLVGDTDTIPTWIGPRIETTTDLYYATMDGEDDWHP
ncbi:MAG TPA: C25 family cysteine peptidase, partial [Anaerolineales bacterium]|nr:C25 family cysteine peptidase [Anaerolineales bacterium]